jgi:nicotinamidase-related amidase
VVALLTPGSAPAAEEPVDGSAPMTYDMSLRPVVDGPSILADFPEYIEPLRADRRSLGAPLVDDPGGRLRVRAWRYCYNVRGIVETENRLDAKATAVVVVHPWGIDDGHGLRTPEPAGVAFFCTVEKNRIGLAHMRDVIDPFLKRLRGRCGVVGYSMPKVEDPVRKLLYASAETRPAQLDRAVGERQLAEVLARHSFQGTPLPSTLALDRALPVPGYFAQVSSTDAGDLRNGPGFWDLPMPVAKPIEVAPEDVVFYDGEGYPKVRDWLRGRGIRHILLAGYCTDMCVISTTCGYDNLSADFNLFLVGDATLATFPGSTTPKYATQVALANAALRQLVTQVGWVQIE